MMAMVGTFLGVGGALLTMLLGSALGLLIGVPVAYARGNLAALGTYLPLGVFLALGAAVAHVHHSSARALRVARAIRIHPRWRLPEPLTRPRQRWTNACRPGMRTDSVAPMAWRRFHALPTWVVAQDRVARRRSRRGR